MYRKMHKIDTILALMPTFYVSDSFAASLVTFWRVSKRVLQFLQFSPVSEAEFLAFVFSAKFQCAIEHGLLSTFDGKIQPHKVRMSISAVL